MICSCCNLISPLSLQSECRFVLQPSSITTTHERKTDHTYRYDNPEVTTKLTIHLTTLKHVDQVIIAMETTIAELLPHRFNCTEVSVTEPQCPAVITVNHTAPLPYHGEVLTLTSDMTSMAH